MVDPGPFEIHKSLSTQFIMAAFAYHIVNAVSNTVLDLSAVDYVSVICRPINGGDSQKWIIQPAGDYYIIRNVRFGTYLGYKGMPFRGATAVVVRYPIQWAIFPEEESKFTAFRFIVPNHDLNLELTEHGSPQGGTPVILAKQTSEKDQLWRLLKA
ncbi:ricin B lectin domain-containing protein [Amanita rubescens]|nr:ricin B lectin domain-containing protein [Amanita rubescens]